DHVSFAALSGMTGAGDDSSDPYHDSYSWDGSASTSPGDSTVTAYNGAGTPSNATFTVTKDTDAPTGQALALTNGAGYYTSASVALSPSDGSDAGAGLELGSRVYERDEADLSGGSCGSFSGSWTAVSNPDTSVQSGKCYVYRL